MTSRDTSTKRASGGADALMPDVPDQRTLRPEPPVRSVEEFVAFLAQLEAVFGPDDRPRGPTIGDRFLL
jgi:hypothetical protein